MEVQFEENQYGNKKISKSQRPINFIARFLIYMKVTRNRVVAINFSYLISIALIITAIILIGQGFSKEKIDEKYYYDKNLQGIK